ncbi:hypothetical protein D3C81_1339340 [compost metagenome]
MEGRGDVRLGHGCVADRVALHGVEVGVERDRRSAGVVAARGSLRGARVAGVGQAEAHVQVAGTAVRDLEQALTHCHGGDLIDHRGGQLHGIGEHCQRDAAVQVGGLQHQAQQLADLQPGFSDASRQDMPRRHWQLAMLGVGLPGTRNRLQVPRRLRCVVMLDHCRPPFADVCCRSAGQLPDGWCGCSSMCLCAGKEHC